MSGPESDDDLDLIVEAETAQISETPVVENVQTDETDKKEPKVKKLRNPQPKLDADRLRGPRGLTVIEGLFKEVRFKGARHEEEDLNLLMKTYEYWCHRLFPKFPFDNCLERLEKLGTTKPVQTYIKRIRMDLEDGPEKPIIDSDDEDVNENDEIPPTASTDDFDNLLPTQFADNSGELTDEQLNRIRLNREQAQLRRKQAMIRNSQLCLGISNENEIRHDSDIIATRPESSSQNSTSNLESCTSQPDFNNITSTSTDEMSIEADVLTSQESETLPTCMSVGSENCNPFSFPKTSWTRIDSMEKSQTDTVMNDVMSQESEKLSTFMSFESEKCVRTGLSEEMIVSEVDSSMDFDSA